MLPLRQIKKIWVIGFGMLLAFQAAGWYLSWGVLMVEAKIEASQTLSEREPAYRQYLTLAVTDLSKLWVGEREIRQNGRLYDVCAQVPQGDSVRLEIYHDAEEEALIDTLFALLANEEDAGKPHYSWLCQLLEATYLVPVLPNLPQRQLGYFLSSFSYRLMCAQSAPAHNGPPPKA